MNAMWVNLPVKDIKATSQFYERLGLQVDTFEDGTMTSITFKDGGVLMFVIEDWFRTTPSYSFSGQPNDTLFSVSVSDEAALTALLDKVRAAGGKVTAEPKILKGYLGAEFDDINGYHFNILVM